MISFEHDYFLFPDTWATKQVGQSQHITDIGMALLVLVQIDWQLQVIKDSVQ